MILENYWKISAYEISRMFADNNDDDGEDSVEAPPFSPLSEADLTTEDESIEEEPGNSHTYLRLS